MRIPRKLMPKTPPGQRFVEHSAVFLLRTPDVWSTRHSRIWCNINIFNVSEFFSNGRKTVFSTSSTWFLASCGCFFTTNGEFGPFGTTSWDLGFQNHSWRALKSMQGPGIGASQSFFCSYDLLLSIPRLGQTWVSKKSQKVHPMAPKAPAKNDPKNHKNLIKYHKKSEIWI